MLNSKNSHSQKERLILIGNQYLQTLVSQHKSISYLETEAKIVQRKAKEYQTADPKLAYLQASGKDLVNIYKKSQINRILPPEIQLSKENIDELLNISDSNLFSEKVQPIYNLAKWYTEQIMSLRKILKTLHNSHTIKLDDKDIQLCENGFNHEAKLHELIQKLKEKVLSKKFYTAKKQAIRNILDDEDIPQPPGFQRFLGVPKQEDIAYLEENIVPIVKEKHFHQGLSNFIVTLKKLNQSHLHNYRAQTSAKQQVNTQKTTETSRSFSGNDKKTPAKRGKF
ncbi:MAG: hypothetical protein VX112_04100 [Pseudomonadota bacterium]|nr:hypothetical protein [Pseudomonadota bacterium]